MPILCTMCIIYADKCEHECKQMNFRTDKQHVSGPANGQASSIKHFGHGEVPLASSKKNDLPGSVCLVMIVISLLLNGKLFGI